MVVNRYESVCPLIHSDWSLPEPHYDPSLLQLTFSSTTSVILLSILLQTSPSPPTNPSFNTPPHPPSLQRRHSDAVCPLNTSCVLLSGFIEIPSPLPLIYDHTGPTRLLFAFCLIPTSPTVSAFTSPSHRALRRTPVPVSYFSTSTLYPPPP